MLTDTVLSITFSDILGAFLDIFRQMTILQIAIFGSASVLTRNDQKREIVRPLGRFRLLKFR